MNAYRNHILFLLNYSATADVRNETSMKSEVGEYNYTLRQELQSRWANRTNINQWHAKLLKHWRVLNSDVVSHCSQIDHSKNHYSPFTPISEMDTRRVILVKLVFYSHTFVVVSHWIRKGANHTIRLHYLSSCLRNLFVKYELFESIWCLSSLSLLPAVMTINRQGQATRCYCIIASLSQLMRAVTKHKLLNFIYQIVSLFISLLKQRLWKQHQTITRD